MSITVMDYIKQNSEDIIYFLNNRDSLSNREKVNPVQLPPNSQNRYKTVFINLIMMKYELLYTYDNICTLVYNLFLFTFSI